MQVNDQLWHPWFIMDGWWFLRKHISGSLMVTCQFSANKQRPMVDCRRAVWHFDCGCNGRVHLRRCAALFGGSAMNTEMMTSHASPSKSLQIAGLPGSLYAEKKMRLLQKSWRNVPSLLIISAGVTGGFSAFSSAFCFFVAPSSLSLLQWGNWALAEAWTWLLGPGDLFGGKNPEAAHGYCWLMLEQLIGQLLIHHSLSTNNSYTVIETIL